MKILFMCVANSARSQIAEGLAKSLLPKNVEIESAGSVPKQVHPMAVAVMAEIGIDLHPHRSKSIDNLKPEFLRNLDYVITLCDEEVCPLLESKAKRFHWPTPDPAGQNHLPREKQIELFRQTRESLLKRLNDFKRDCEL